MQIAIDYKDPCLLKEMKSRSTSGIVKKLMAFNFYVTGAIETIYVSNLRMNRDGICHPLNERLNGQKLSDERQS